MRIWHGEKLLQTYFKALYNQDFTLHRRPEWLVSATGAQLEFDGYCPDLGIAIEHNGDTHYRFTPPFHKTPLDFIRQKRNDRRKVYLCKKAGVQLIIIRKLYTQYSPTALPALVERIYAKKQLRLPPDFSKVIVKSNGQVFKHKRVFFYYKWEEIV